MEQLSKQVLLDNLKHFKFYMLNGFVTHCNKEFSKEVFDRYIRFYLDDFLEGIELSIEDLSEEVQQDLDFNFYSTTDEEE